VSGVGIDLLEIARLERALARRPGLARRLFTDAERAYAASRARPGQHLAARLCAKEAVAKALALDAWSWREVEIDARGRVALSGAVAARAGARGGRLRVSLTHSRTMAGAVALLYSA
jgi:holo-[acyl-carrier protein] synthase